MAPVEIRPLYASHPTPPAPPVTPAGAMRVDARATTDAPAGGRRFDFAANVDGPWVRSRQEIARTMGVLIEVAEEAWEIGARRGSTPNDAETYVIGVFAAANWSLATVTRAPMSNVDSPVSDRIIRAELDLAREMVKHQDKNMVAYAIGVLTWFTWLAGITDTIKYPVKEAF